MSLCFWCSSSLFRNRRNVDVLVGLVVTSVNPYALSCHDVVAMVCDFLLSPLYNFDEKDVVSVT